MAAYDEFRVVVTPVMTTPGTWSVRVDESPVKAQVGISQKIQPAITRPQLAALRMQSGWPNNAALKVIGESVWNSVLKAIGPYFDASVQWSSTNGRGLRIVLVRNQADADVPQAGAIALSELPFEATYEPGPVGFVGTNVRTPLSRSLQVRPDYVAERIEPPLKVLIVAAEPVGKPTSKAKEEAAAIGAALAPLAGQVCVLVCPDGSYSGFRQQLTTFRPHVVHFIGHGGYAPVGSDPTPVPHLCFEDPATHATWPIDADVLSAGLQNQDVRLLVLTACSTAAATPGVGAIYEPGAMEGLAQTLVFGPSGVRAAVAMQFDFEGSAAVAFSREFYHHLPNTSLDEAVTYARVQITQEAGFGLGHRAWVCPVVYSRYVDHRVFDLDPFGQTNPTVAAQLRSYDESFKVVLQMLDDALKKAVPGFSVQQFLGGLRQLDDRRSELLKQGVRLSIEGGAAGRRVTLRLLLRLAAAGPVDLVETMVRLPAGFTAGQPAAGAGGAVPTMAQLPLGARVLVAQPSAGAAWPAGEHELAAIPIDIAAGTPPGAYQLELGDAALTRGGARTALRVIPAQLLVEKP